MNPYRAHIAFMEQFYAAMERAANDPEVVGFKSIACYRTGLNIPVIREGHDVEQCVTMVMLRYEVTRTLRLADKYLNDYVVNVALRVASDCGKPGQLYTSESWIQLTTLTSQFNSTRGLGIMTSPWVYPLHHTCKPSLRVIRTLKLFSFTRVTRILAMLVTSLPFIPTSFSTLVKSSHS